MEELVTRLSASAPQSSHDVSLYENWRGSFDNLGASESFDILSALQGFPGEVRSEVIRPLSLKVCDAPACIESGKDLLRMAEFAAAKITPPDFALLFCVVEQARGRLRDLSASEIIGLLSLCARMEFVDSNFNEAMHEYVPRVLDNFSDNHFPPLFASCLRLGLDQPVDRAPEGVVSDAHSSAFMEKLIRAVILRVPKISEGGCLAILQSIVRRPRAKISPEMDDLVKAISENAKFDDWSLSMRIQAIHALSRLGIENQAVIGALLSAVNSESITKIPSANLQHLLSIVHNHSVHHDPALSKRVLGVCLQRIVHPSIAKTMPMATVAVTIGYLGRLNLRNDQATDSLLRVFSGIGGRSSLASRKISLDEGVSEKFVHKILTDSQVDVAHLTGILEALQKLNMWHLSLSVPLLLITRRLVLRDGIHNVRFAPLGVLCQCLLQTHFGLDDEKVFLIDAKIDRFIDSCSSDKSGNWSLQSQAEIPKKDWRKQTVLSLLEGLLKHDQYIRTAASANVMERCLQIRTEINGLIPFADLPPPIQTFFNSLD
jgi:hypothetical protein